MNRNAIIVGASSGIGAQLAVDLAERGFNVGIAARRIDQLNELASSLPNRTAVRAVDVNSPDQAICELRSLIDEMGDVELFVLSSGVGHENTKLDWGLERETLTTNVVGFAAMANVAVKHLADRQSGHLVGISSIAAIRGNGVAPSYGASKAFVSHYLEALRHRFSKAGIPVTVLDVQPGFVDTAMAKGEGLFWGAPVPKASRQILRAIERRKTHVFVTRRWRLIAWLLRWLPTPVYNRL